MRYLRCFHHYRLYRHRLYRHRLYRYRLLLGLCLCTLLATVCLGSFSNSYLIAGTKIAKANNAAASQTQITAVEVEQLVNEGINSYYQGDFQAAIEAWQIAYSTYSATQDWSALVTISENLARAYQQIGETIAEVDYWQKAIDANAQLEETNAETAVKLAHLLTGKAQAYRRLGQHAQAIALLCGEGYDAAQCDQNTAIALAYKTNNIASQTAALGSLGEIYRATGDYQQAIAIFQQGIRAAQQLELKPNNIRLVSAAFNSLGHALLDLAQVNNRRAQDARAQGNVDVSALQTQANRYSTDAISAFQKSHELAMTSTAATSQLQPLIGLALSYREKAEIKAAMNYWQQAKRRLPALANSQQKAFIAIQLADIVGTLKSQETAPRLETEAKTLLSEALTVGQALNNSRVISFALGKLAQLEENNERYESALEMTRAARLAANQNIANKDSLYLWEWQIGRILHAQGQREGAQQAYQRAVAVLDRIRNGILGTSRSVQFDFRDRVEPVYREYAQIALETIPTDISLQSQSAAYDQLDKAVVALDSLQVAELQSYFENDCVISPAVTRIDATQTLAKTGTISTAILAANNNADSTDKQLIVILSGSDGSKKVSRTIVGLPEITRQVTEFRRALESGTLEYIEEYRAQAPSEKLYEWLIKPFEADIANLDTLIFVNDGLLRSVPMAALYDEASEEYLIEKVAIATTPSLQLVTPRKTQRPSQLSALLIGVSEETSVEGRYFGNLPNVEKEIAAISEAMPKNKQLINEAFSTQALRRELSAEDYRILHIATHGTFGFDPEDNFVVTGVKRADSFNETLTISNLDRLIRAVATPERQPIELLTLTACDTAIGSSRATLGLAGIAVRAGVRSAIATLWSVSDESSANLIADFYNNLNQPDITKAEALRLAQIAMIRSDIRAEKHPYRWSSFVLIGNWL